MSTSDERGTQIVSTPEFEAEVRSIVDDVVDNVTRPYRLLAMWCGLGWLTMTVLSIVQVVTR